MKGLLRKDLMIILERKIVFVFMIFFAAIVPFITGADIDFILGYASVIFLVTAISTIAYDDSDNCLEYIMTMPITRKTYAMSKYITCCVVILVGNIVTISLYVSVGYIVGENIDIKEVLIIMLAIFGASMIAGSVGIPSNLKFGVQKGSVMMIVFIAGISALGMMIFKILEFFEVNVQEIFLTLTSWDEGALIATAAAAVIIITTISYLISERIMIKKEF